MVHKQQSQAPQKSKGREERAEKEQEKVTEEEQAERYEHDPVFRGLVDYFTDFVTVRSDLELAAVMGLPPRVIPWRCSCYQSVVNGRKLCQRDGCAAIHNMKFAPPKREHHGTSDRR